MKNSVVLQKEGSLIRKGDIAMAVNTRVKEETKSLMEPVDLDWIIQFKKDLLEEIDDYIDGSVPVCCDPK